MVFLKGLYGRQPPPRYVLRGPGEKTGIPGPSSAAQHKSRRNITADMFCATYLRASASSTGPGKAGCRRPCGRRHVAGERLFVDYAGTTLEVIDGPTGEVRPAQIFVAVLGASSYTYAEATWTQALPDWIGAHTRAFAFFGGVPAMVVSDNLKSGHHQGVLLRAGGQPHLRRDGGALRHGDPAGAALRSRATRPRSRSRAAGERWILAKLRNRQFFSLAELNDAIAETASTALNDRVTRHLGASRRALFEELERPALKPLPAEPYVYAEWKQCRVGLDYHVEVERHYYSVPHTLLREKLWARITARTVELFHRGKRVAAHVRSSSNRKHTTVREHMPSSHRRYADWTPERMQRQAGEIGPQHRGAGRAHPARADAPRAGLPRLPRHPAAAPRATARERLEAACDRALEIGARSYTSVNSILKNNLDRQRPAPATDGPAIAHANIRGPRYFH